MAAGNNVTRTSIVFHAYDLLFVKAYGSSEVVFVCQLLEHVVSETRMRNNRRNGGMRTEITKKKVKVRYLSPVSQSPHVYAYDANTYSEVDPPSIYGLVGTFQTVETDGSGLLEKIRIDQHELDRMTQIVNMQPDDEPADISMYLDESEQISAASLAASRGVANSGARVDDPFLAGGGGGMEASSSRGGAAERAARIAELITAAGATWYTPAAEAIERQVDEEIIAERNAEFAASSDGQRRSRRTPKPTAQGLMSIASETP